MHSSGSPSGPSPFSPVPAMSSSLPVFASIIRTLWLSVVGEIDVAVGRDGDALRAGERGFLRGAAVAGEALLSGAGDVVNLAGLEVELEDLIALARGEPEVALRVEVERARAVQRRAGDRRAVGRRAGFAGAGEGGDDAGLHVHLADDVVADVADVEVARGVELDAVRLLELRVLRRAAVAASSRACRCRRRW